MKRTRIKICGIRDQATLDAVMEAGADFVGFVVAESPRRLSIAEAAELIGRCEAITPVLVTQRPRIDEARTLAQMTERALVQSEWVDLPLFSPDVVQRYLPVVRGPAHEAPEAMRRCGCVLIESPNSGVGQRADWDRAAELAAMGRVILAGGLTPDNVAEAITQVRPWAVDVSSGVESSRGVKDLGRIRAFVSAVRAADAPKETQP